MDWSQKTLNVTQLFGTVCYLTDVVHVQNSTTSFLHLAFFCYPRNPAVTLPPLWEHLCLCGVICGWGTQPLDFLKQGLWLRFCTECVCLSLRSIHAGNLMDLKSGILFTEEKGKRHWLLDKWSLTEL